MGQDFDPAKELFLDHMAALTLQYPEVSCFDCLRDMLGNNNALSIRLMFEDSESGSVKKLNLRARTMFTGRRRKVQCIPGPLSSFEKYSL